MLKDWKKSKVDTSWYHVKIPYSVVRVWKIGLPSYERKRRGIGLYGTLGRVGRNGRQTKKTFKTKIKALTYAKSYMRTH